MKEWCASSQNKSYQKSRTDQAKSGTVQPKSQVKRFPVNYTKTKKKKKRR